MVMRVLFRTDASYSIGSGHVMRCLTLAKALKNDGAQVEFICRNHDGNLNNHIRNKGFKVNELTIENTTSSESWRDDGLFHSAWLGVSQFEDANQCLDVLSKKSPDWLIVDHYALDKNWEKQLKNHYAKLMVIDDLADREHVCDILLDQTYGRDASAYRPLVAPYCQMLMGSNFALLREEFSQLREQSLARRDSETSFKHLLISMGGVDPDNITGQVLEELKSCDLSLDLKVKVILGVTSPNLEEVKKIAKTLPYETEVKINVSNMAEIMANADLAIGAAGATSWERCCLGLPSLLWVLAENQKLIAENLNQNKIVKVFDSINDICTHLVQLNNQLSVYSMNSRKVTDGLGTERVKESMNA